MRYRTWALSAALLALAGAPASALGQSGQVQIPGVPIQSAESGGATETSDDNESGSGQPASEAPDKKQEGAIGDANGQSTPSKGQAHRTGQGRQAPASGGPQPGGGTAATPGGTGSAGPPKTPSEPETLAMTPGVNQIVPISSGHLNRFLTPFDDPEVESADLKKGSVTVKGRVVLIATEQKPATLFITPKGADTPALSLTLIPKAIPPRQIALRMERSQGGRAHRPQAEDWETGQPYEETLRNLLRKVAKGDVPSGYTIRKPEGQEAPVVCNGPGNERLRYKTGQVIEGSRMMVKVAVAANPTDRVIELNETGCYHQGVLAVAAWPSPLLEPGDRTEVMQVVRRETGGSGGRMEQDRPSLLNDRAFSAEEGEAE